MFDMSIVFLYETYMYKKCYMRCDMLDMSSLIWEWDSEIEFFILDVRC